MISINRYKLAIYCFHPFHFSRDVEDADKSLPIKAGETAQLAKDLLSKHENLSWVPGTYIKPRSNGEPFSMSLEDRQKDPWSALASQPSQSVSSRFRERLSLKKSKVEKQLRKTVLISVVTRTQGVHFSKQNSYWNIGSQDGGQGQMDISLNIEVTLCYSALNQQSVP